LAISLTLYYPQLEVPLRGHLTSCWRTLTAPLFFWRCSGGGGGGGGGNADGIGGDAVCGGASCGTAMKKLRIVILGFGTARQKWSLNDGHIQNPLA
jgi:hypothetical protein